MFQLYLFNVNPKNTLTDIVLGNKAFFDYCISYDFFHGLKNYIYFQLLMQVWLIGVNYPLESLKDQMKTRNSIVEAIWWRVIFFYCAKRNSGIYFRKKTNQLHNCKWKTDKMRLTNMIDKLMIHAISWINLHIWVGHIFKGFDEQH